MVWYGRRIDFRNESVIFFASNAIILARMVNSPSLTTNSMLLQLHSLIPI